MPDPALFDLLPAVRALALEAGALILRYYEAHAVATAKADGSPVTEADRAAEALITPALHRLLPGVPVVAEEAAAIGELPEIDAAGRFWLVDPLDGTKEFVNRNGDFTVNIALIGKGRPLLGVVFAPVAGDLYTGIVGGEARLERPGEPERAISAREPPKRGWVAVGSRNHYDPAIEGPFLAGFPIGERRSRGSSLKFGLVAEGAADIYPRIGPTCEWDTAAGHAVLLAAGGRVDEIGGGPLRYGKPGFRNPPFVAFGRTLVPLPGAGVL
ncbi:MAG: 3'(2'),5'-bisphosphate nucleotidase CysQ [Rhodospirillaceae bacterium]